jgi:DNA invertase Pin-like site-specific DNA recombinase
MSKPKRAALYLRVSTGEQTTENQRLALRQEAERRGWTIVREYEDAGISGAKGRDKRPGLDSMLKDATRGRFDVVMCWSLDRLGRSLRSLIDTAEELESASVDLYAYQQSIDTTNPAGKMFFHVVGAFSQYEREMIRERVVAGLARVKAKGKKLGRPKIAPDIEARVRASLASGVGIISTAKACGVGTSTVQRIKRDMPPASPPEPLPQAA